MYFPTIDGTSKQRIILEGFGGLNRSNSCRDNEFTDMENMTGDGCPYLTVRPRRKAVANFTEDGTALDFIVTDSGGGDGYNAGTGVRLTENSYEFYERGERKRVYKKIKFANEIEDEDGETVYLRRPMDAGIRGLIKFGNNVISYPRPQVINQALPRNAEEDTESVNFYEGNGTSRSIWLGSNSNAYGVYFGGYNSLVLKKNFFRIVHVSNKDATLPAATTTYENSYVIYISDLYGSLRYSAEGRRLRLERFATENGVVRLTGEDFGAAFFVIENNLGKTSEGDYKLLVRGYQVDGTPLVDKGLDFVCKGSDLKAGNGVFATTVRADANLLAVHQNRIWGTDTLGTSLYCSSATDIYNWEIDGTAAGGGYVDVAEYSPWTAICEYGGYLYAFKENKMYKVMGSTALDYQILSVCDIGCVNHEAVCICDSVLYFLSRDGVYAFSGNLPVKVSDALQTKYRFGRFEGRGGKVYASLEAFDGKSEFLVYDAAKHTWHKEDAFKVRSFVDYTDGIYALGEDRVCYKLEGAAESVPFSFTTKQYFYQFDQKAVGAVYLFLDMEPGTETCLEISYDGGEFISCGHFSDCRLKYIPVRLRKCDTFQLRISGEGSITLKQMEFVLYSGGRSFRQ